MELLQEPHELAYFKKLIIHEREELKIIDQRSILRVESDRSYSRIFLLDDSVKLVSRPLKAIQKELSTDLFFRIHRSHLVNLGGIKSIYKGCKRLRLVNNTLLPFAEKNYEALIQAIKTFGPK